MFSRLYLEITTCCNLACSFCPGTARPAAFVTPETFRTLAAKLRPYGQYLYLHVMGEPLLHPQLPELLEICRALDFRVTLTTNGTLLPARQPVLLAAQLGAQGKTSFTETIFENRFLYVQELRKLGAKLSQDGRTVRLQGAEPLHAARLHAGDLRGGAALVLGAMQAEGESTIFGVKHIQRGYDNLEAALQSAGARLKTVEIPIKV